MKKIFVTRVDSNNTDYILSSVNAANREWVNIGQLIGVGETTKVTFDINSDFEGYLYYAAIEGKKNKFTDPFCYIFNTLDELEKFEAIDRNNNETKLTEFGGVRVTRKAIELAKRHGINIDTFPKDLLITEEYVIDLLNKEKGKVNISTDSHRYKTANGQKKRLLIVGSGMGASQVLDILDTNFLEPIGLIDDDFNKIGKTLMGLHVLGNVASIPLLYEDGYFDQIIISVSTSVEFRYNVFNEVQGHGIVFANVIDKSVKISKRAEIGKGNVICYGSQVANDTILGDNNFISSLNSFDHHNSIGSSISTGPGCMTSGLVAIEDQVRLGTGIFIEPYLKIGSRSIVSSGSIIRADVPTGVVVKNKADNKFVKLN